MEGESLFYPSLIVLFALFSCCLESLPVCVKKKEKLQKGYGHLSVRQIMYDIFLNYKRLIGRITCNNFLVYVNRPDLFVNFSSLMKNVFSWKENVMHFCPGDPVTCSVFHLHWKPIEGELDVELFSLHKWHSVLNYRNMLVESPYLASWSVVLGRTYKNI